MQRLSKIDRNKIYMLLSQVAFMGTGYLTQTLLSRLILTPQQFSDYQFVNFLTNTLNLFVATTVPVILSREIAKVRDESKANQELSSAWQSMLWLLTVQTVITLGLATVFMLQGLTSGNQFGLIVLASLQVITYSLMNLLNLFIIGKKQITLFIRFYLSYIVIKSLLIVLSAYFTQNIYWVAVVIIVSQIIDTSLILLVVRPKIALIQARIPRPSRKYLAEHWDILAANLLIFGAANLSVVIPYFGLSSDVAAFNIYTLVQPWTLLPFYLISAIANIYLVEFASGQQNLSNLLKIMRDILLLAVILSAIGISAGAIFFALIYPDYFAQAIYYLLLTAPFGIIVSLISIALAVYQGMGEMHKVRNLIIIAMLFYVVLSILSLELNFIVMLSNITYFVFLVLVVAKVATAGKKLNLNKQAPVSI